MVAFGNPEPFQVDPQEGLDGEFVPPKAGAFVEALRAIGYSLESAVADLIDNSVAAEATTVDIRFGWSQSGSPWLAMLDNGHGMAEAELTEAMRPGTRSPLEPRDPRDLGRFGLGLKTASFSQCRRLSVVTRRGGQTTARCWDLDVVSKLDQWLLLRLNATEIASLPVIDELGSQGTLVVWQKLDRIDFGAGQGRRQELFNEKMAVIREHLALVFHRYLAGEQGIRRVMIRINLQPIPPFDPFNSKNPSTTYLPEEPIPVNGEMVLMQAYILPHHSLVSADEYQTYGGAEGYLRSQGFYVYRNKRLIIHGTWFRMARQDELTKLARVRVDIPNTLDHLWTIDVRKSKAQPPEVIRQRMKALVEGIRANAKRPYTHRGTVLAQRSASPVWQRREFNDRIHYEVNADHPVLADFCGDLEESLRKRFNLLLQVIASSIPKALLFSDMAVHPERIDAGKTDTQLLEVVARQLRSSFPGETTEEFRMRLRALDPFAACPSFIDAWIDPPQEVE